MGSVEITAGVVIIGIVAIIAAIVLFKVARRTMKFVVRAVIFGIIVIALLIGGTLFYFSRSGSGKPANSNANRPANTKRKQPD